MWFLLRREVNRAGERGVNAPRRDLAVLDRVDDLAAVAQAVAAGEEPGDARRAGGADRRRSVPCSHFKSGQGGDQVEQRLLPERLDHHVGGEDEVRSPAPSRTRPDREFGSSSSVRRNSTPGAVPPSPSDADRLGEPLEPDAVGPWRARIRRRTPGSAPRSAGRRSSPSRPRAAWRRSPRRSPCCRRRSPATFAPTDALGERPVWVWKMKSSASQTPSRSSPSIASGSVRPRPMPRKTASNVAEQRRGPRRP